MSKVENFNIICKECGSNIVILSSYCEYDDWYGKLRCTNCDNEESE